MNQSRHLSGVDEEPCSLHSKYHRLGEQICVCFSTHRPGRTWGFLWSWAQSRCRPVLLWSTWPAAGSASGGGGSSAPGPPSQTHPALCPLKEGNQDNLNLVWSSLSSSTLIFIINYHFSPTFLSNISYFLALNLHQLRQKHVKPAPASLLSLSLLLCWVW